MSEVSSNYTGPLESDIKMIEARVKQTISSLEKPYLKILKKTYQCSSDCYAVSEYSLKESHECQQECMAPLERIRSRHETSFAKYDTITNVCLHSCTKQKRKSDYLSGDALQCYKDCLSRAHSNLEKLEEVLLTTYNNYST